MSFQIPTTTTAGATGFSFGLATTTTAAAKPGSFSFGGTGSGDAGTSQPLKFGTQPTAAVAATSTPAATGFGSGFFSGATTTNTQPAQQPAVAAVAPSLGGATTLFNATAAKPIATTMPVATTAGGLNFAAPAAVSAAAASTASAAPATNFGFGTKSATTPAAIVSAAPLIAPANAAPAPVASAFALPTAKTTIAPLPALGTVTATTAVATPAAGGFASLTTATKTTDSSAVASTQLSYNQIEENINKWTLELEEQEKVFIDQATQINAWDKILIANNNKILELNDAVQKVKSDQQTLEQELEFIATQHKELEESIIPLQKEFIKLPQVDVERSQTYLLVENLDTQLKQMSEDLKEIIDNLNEANKGQDNTDPIIQIGKILNAHMSSLQWIETSTSNISNKLDDITKMHESFKRESERSFRSAYFN